VRVYLDNLATTPLDPRVREEMEPFLSGQPGNPHSTAHEFGEAAAAAVDKARKQVATAVGASPSEVYFTPSATSSNNVAVIGAALAREKKGRHVIVSSIEHPSVLEAARELSRRGFSVDEAPVGPEGVVDPDDVGALLRPDTVLVSVMAVNNEVGTLQPIDGIADIVEGGHALLHCDAAQAPGKVGMVMVGRADMITLSSHKAYGPQGAAALVIRRRRQVRPAPRIFGGGQEGGVWPGTVNVAATVGFGHAMELAGSEPDNGIERVRGLSMALERGVRSVFPATSRNGEDGYALPHCLSLVFKDVSGETVMSTLSGNGIAASFGSACASQDGSPSHVLTAMGISPADARRTIRFGPGRFTTSEEIDYTLDVIERLARKLGR